MKMAPSARSVALRDDGDVGEIVNQRNDSATLGSIFYYLQKRKKEEEI